MTDDQTTFEIPARGTDEYEFMKQVLYARDGTIICSEGVVRDLVIKAGGSVVKTGPDMEMKFPMYWEDGDE